MRDTPMRDDQMRDDLEPELDLDTPETTLDAAPNAARRAAAPSASWAGAVLALAAIIGVGLWLYGLGTRDVERVPVIMAAATPAKTRPVGEDAAGSTRYQDMQSYAAAEGEAPAAGDEIVLTPPPARPTEEDAAIAVLEEQASAAAALPESAPAQTPGQADVASEAAPSQRAAPDPELEPAPLAGAPEDAMTDADAAALAEEVEAALAEAALAEAARAEATRAEATEVDGGTAPEEPLDATALAPGKSPTAPARPRDLKARMAQAAQAAEVDAEQLAIRAATSPFQVQLGAYRSDGQARAEWRRINRQHQEVLVGRAAHIETTKSGGETWYRLRVGPFSGDQEARSVCQVLKARGQDCIVAAEG